jgi:endo-1,4-beta-mannosidase
LTLNGQAFRFDGMNIPQAIQAPCWFRSDLQSGLTSIGSGQEVIRVFALQRTATTNGARDWQYVDAMLATLRGHGQRAILVLADQWKGQPCTDSTTNRTLSWYQTGYRSTVEGATTYRDWVAQIVTRYRNDPTVAFWQLVNEADARNGDGSCSEATARTALRAFADDVAGLIKSIDDNHLVSLGTTPGQCGSNEADFAAVHAGPDIDICDYHDYRYPYSPMGNTDAWNGVQVSIDRCRALGKPLFMGELGMGFSSLSTPTTAYRATLFDAKLAAQFRAGSVGELFWTWSNTFSSTPPRDMEIAPGDPALALIRKY